MYQHSSFSIQTSKNFTQYKSPVENYNQNKSQLEKIPLHNIWIFSPSRVCWNNNRIIKPLPPAAVQSEWVHLRCSIIRKDRFYYRRPPWRRHGYRRLWLPTEETLELSATISPPKIGSGDHSASAREVIRDKTALLLLLSKPTRSIIKCNGSVPLDPCQAISGWDSHLFIQGHSMPKSSVLKE